ncbi:MAG: hypothetical protein ACRC1M_07555 [Methanobacteriaceae archaeon]
MEDIDKLINFIKFLNNELGFSFNIDIFNHRLKLQKYVFLAKVFGWNHNYDYSLYIRGPYSPELAEDYYKISTKKKVKSLDILSSSNYSPSNYSINELDLNTNGFITLVRDKNISYLEVATTMLSLYSAYTTKFKNNIDELIEDTYSMKPNVSKNLINKVAYELRDENLFN